MLTGIALSATMMVSGIAGYATKDCHDIDCNHLTASAYSHSCGQFVYDSTAWKYVAGYKDDDGAIHAIYDEYYVRRCRNCDSIKYWYGKTGRRKLVIRW